MSRLRAATVFAATSALLAAGVPSVGRAETLAEAISLAYATNPNLQQQRAQQRALDESYVQARSGWRPTASAQANAGFTYTGFHGASDTNAVNLGLTAAQPLYTGGRTTAAVDAAQADVLAGREGLRGLEAQVLQTVVQYFEDVRRDQQVVAIRRENVIVLQNQLNETQARLEVGQLTRTDTAQAQAQLAQARAQLTSALTQLQISRANYTAVVGQNPGELAPPPTLPGLPTSVDQAFDIAERANAGLEQARVAEQASRYRVAQARAAKRPTVFLQGSVGVAGSIAPFDPRDLLPQPHRIAGAEPAAVHRRGDQLGDPPGDRAEHRRPRRRRGRPAQRGAERQPSVEHHARRP